MPESLPPLPAQSYEVCEDYYFCITAEAPLAIKDGMRLYDATQLTAYATEAARQAREKALEEAAAVCDAMPGGMLDDTSPMDCAGSIRALKERANG